MVAGTGYADLIRASPALHPVDLQRGPFHEVDHRQAGAEALVERFDIEPYSDFSAK